MPQFLLITISRFSPWQCRLKYFSVHHIITENWLEDIEEEYGDETPHLESAFDEFRGEGQQNGILYEMQWDLGGRGWRMKTWGVADKITIECLL